MQPQAGRLGNQGTQRAVGLVNFDLSAFKRFPFGEKRFVQFRADFFNAFNHARFQVGASRAVTSATCGRITLANRGSCRWELQVSF